MAIAYYGTTLSPNMDRTPEGFLICRNVPINRTGTQIYGAGELNLTGDPDRAVRAYRLAEDVFDPAALASFEGKDITRGHPPALLTAETQAAYSKGHLENVRREGDKTVADLIIKDPALASDVENGVLRQVSCGYHCRFEPYRDGYKQTEIRGNHVAIVPKGRAGETVSIQDQSAQPAEKGRERMKEFWKSFLTAFGMAAKEANPEEMGQMADAAAAVLDADTDAAAAVLDADTGAAQDAGPQTPAEPAPAQGEGTPKGDDLGGKLDRLLELLEAQKGGREEPALHDETDLDELMEKLSGQGGENRALTIPAENGDACLSGPARDAALRLLKKARPAVAAIPDKKVRAKVTDALLSAVQGEDPMGPIVQAAQDSARAKARQAAGYETRCAEAQKAYAARNPHLSKEETK